MTTRQRSWKSNSPAGYRFPSRGFLVFSRTLGNDGNRATATRRRQNSLPIQRLTHGAIAQLGERFHGMEEVVGSIPTGSTTTPSTRIPRDPAADLRGASNLLNSGHFATITEPAGIGALLRAIDGYEGTFVGRCALRLAPLVFVRPGSYAARSGPSLI